MAKEKQALPKINEALIKKVIAHIKEDYRRYYQDIVGEKIELGSSTNSSGEFINSAEQMPACGTQACFGGWAALLTTPKNKWKSLFRKDEMTVFALFKAGVELGLTKSEADFLFSTTELKSPKENLQIIEKRLKFIRKERRLKEEYEILLKETEVLRTQFEKFTNQVDKLESKVESLKEEITTATNNISTEADAIGHWEMEDLIMYPLKNFL